MVTGMMRYLLVAGPHAHLTEIPRGSPEKSWPVRGSGLARSLYAAKGQSPGTGRETCPTDTAMPPAAPRWTTAARGSEPPSDGGHTFPTPTPHARIPFLE